jgi:hypothetical protein
VSRKPRGGKEWGKMCEAASGVPRKNSQFASDAYDERSSSSSTFTQISFVNRIKTFGMSLKKKNLFVVEQKLTRSGKENYKNQSNIITSNF